MEFLWGNSPPVVGNDGNLHFCQATISPSAFFSRATSCSMVFVIQNIKIYFDACSTCASERNSAIRRSLANITAFQQPLNLIMNNGTTSQVSSQICSTPNITTFGKIETSYFHHRTLLFSNSSTSHIECLRSTTDQLQSYTDYNVYDDAN